MSNFTDPLSAIEEAEYISEMTGMSQSIIRHGDDMAIMPYCYARLEGAPAKIVEPLYTATRPAAPGCSYARTEI